MWLKVCSNNVATFPDILNEGADKQDSDGNTYGHLYIIYKQKAPPKNLYNHIRNNYGITMA